MSGWERVRPVAPGDHKVTVRTHAAGSKTVLTVRVPIAIAESFHIEEGDEFELYLDGSGKRLQFRRVQLGDVVAKSYSGQGPTKALNISVSMLSFVDLFKKQEVEHQSVSDHLTLALPIAARQAVA